MTLGEYLHCGNRK